MAQFSKYSPASIGRLFLHNNRMQNDGVVHSNESIDNERTYQNYHFKKGTPEDVKERLSEVFIAKKRNNTTVVGEFVVTLPKDVKDEDERDFFQAVYDFYCNDLGEENIVNAVVHKDETTPHMHLDFVPVLKGEQPQFTSNECLKSLEDWKANHGGEMPTERICCKDLISRKYLSTMHQRLSDYVQSYLGYKTEILNGATNGGNKTVLQMKVESLKKQIGQMEEQKEHLAKELNSMLTVAKNYGIEKNDIGIYPLLQRIADLENQNDVLKSLITRQGYSWKKDELVAMQAKKYVPAKATPVNFYSGSLVDAEIEDDAIVIIELPNQASRPSPQQKFLDEDMDSERQASFARSSSRPITVRPSRTSKRSLVFIKTDSPKETMENLILLEHQLKAMDCKGRRVYMDKMETDEYDLTRAILEKNHIEASYFIHLEDEKEKANDSQEQAQEKA